MVRLANGSNPPKRSRRHDCYKQCKLYQAERRVVGTQASLPRYAGISAETTNPIRPYAMLAGSSEEGSCMAFHGVISLAAAKAARGNIVP